METTHPADAKTADAKTADAKTADAKTADAQGAGRTRLRRHPERAVPAETEAILRAGRIAHVAFAVDGQPYVLPFGYFYEEGTLYLHGAPASRTLKTLRTGVPVCVEVTLLDGLVASRDAKSHSMNYRSAVVFGRAEAVSGEGAKRAIFERMTARYFPNRTADRDYHAALKNHLRAVELLAVRVEEMGAKKRVGPPLGTHDTAADAGFGSSFVLDLPGIDS